MIQVHILKAKHNVVLQKNGTFLEGEKYFGRLSKNEDFYVVRSEEGYWIPVEFYRYAKRKDKREHFETITWFTTKSRKDLNPIPDVGALEWMKVL